MRSFIGISDWIEQIELIKQDFEIDYDFSTLEKNLKVNFQEKKSQLEPTSSSFNLFSFMLQIVYCKPSIESKKTILIVCVRKMKKKFY